LLARRSSRKEEGEEGEEEEEKEDEEVYPRGRKKSPTKRIFSPAIWMFEGKGQPVVNGCYF